MSAVRGMRARRDRRGERDLPTLSVALQQQPERERKHHERRGAGRGGEAPMPAESRVPGYVPAVGPRCRPAETGRSNGSRNSSGSGLRRRRQYARSSSRRRRPPPRPVDVVVVLTGWTAPAQPPRVGVGQLLPQARAIARRPGCDARREEGSGGLTAPEASSTSRSRTSGRSRDRRASRLPGRRRQPASAPPRQSVRW